MIPVCFSCKQSYFSVSDVLKVKRCSCCGKELISTNGNCLQCREEPVIKSADRVIPIFSYRLWNKELLFLWKINGIRTLSAFYADLVWKVLIQLKVKIIVPVPPRPGKIKKNGWDQIDELCSFLRLRYGFKVLNVLERNSSEQQKKMDRQERLSNIEGAYSIVSSKRMKKALIPFQGCFPESVCIIDDVCTTGSTLECCSKLLRNNTKVKEIFCVTLFTVD